MTKDSALSFRIPSALKEALKARADADDRKLADYVARVLRAHVEATPDPSARHQAKVSRTA